MIANTEIIFEGISAHFSKMQYSLTDLVIYTDYYKEILKLFQVGILSYFLIDFRAITKQFRPIAEIYTIYPRSCFVRCYRVPHATAVLEYGYFPFFESVHEYWYPLFWGRSALIDIPGRSRPDFSLVVIVVHFDPATQDLTRITEGILPIWSGKPDL